MNRFHDRELELIHWYRLSIPSKLLYWLSARNLIPLSATTLGCASILVAKYIWEFVIPW